jgi:hypothetical protein
MELFSNEFDLIKFTSIRHSAKIALYYKQKKCFVLFYSEPFRNTLICDFEKSLEIIKTQSHPFSDFIIVVYCHQKEEYFVKLIDTFVKTKHPYTNIVLITIRIEPSRYIVSDCVYEYDEMFQRKQMIPLLSYKTYLKFHFKSHLIYQHGEMATTVFANYNLFVECIPIRTFYVIPYLPNIPDEKILTNLSYCRDKKIERLYRMCELYSCTSEENKTLVDVIKLYIDDKNILNIIDDINQQLFKRKVYPIEFVKLNPGVSKLINDTVENPFFKCTHIEYTCTFVVEIEFGFEKFISDLTKSSKNSTELIKITNLIHLIRQEIIS